MFGYIVEGAELLADMQVGDRIDYIKVTEGGQFLQAGARKASAPAPATEVAAAAE